MDQEDCSTHLSINWKETSGDSAETFCCLWWNWCMFSEMRWIAVGRFLIVLFRKSQCISLIRKYDIWAKPTLLYKHLTNTKLMHWFRSCWCQWFVLKMNYQSIQYGFGSLENGLKYLYFFLGPYYFLQLWWYFWKSNFFSKYKNIPIIKSSKIFEVLFFDKSLLAIT